MRKEETLAQIKEAEKSVRQAMEAAANERERILRDTRREGFELRESLRKAAEQRQEEVLRQAEAAFVRDKERVLAQGTKDAEALRQQATANVERAVDRLIEKFKGALNA